MIPGSFSNVSFDDVPPEAAHAIDGGSKRSNQPHTGKSNSASSAPTAQLSCELCRQRKVKCDKSNPCSTCRRAGVTCIPVTRQRLPRGRVGGRKRADAELKARVGRLEKLVRSLDPTVALSDEDPSQSIEKQSSPSDRDGQPSTASPESEPRKGRVGTERYIASQFWSDLSHEVNGLKDTLVDSSEDEVDDFADLNITDTGVNEDSSRQFDVMILNPGSFVVEPTLLQHPPQSFRIQLCHIYMAHVNPMMKLIHGPSLRSFMEHGQSYLHYQPGHPAAEAISYAMYYVAVCSQPEEDCLNKLGVRRIDALARYRIATEVSLARAGLVTTNDITVLQAFMVYILATRSYDTSKRSWSLLALAVQIARGLGLDREPAIPSMRPFDQEMRRRVWYTLTVLDTQSAMDRAYNPIILPNSFSTRLPLNINDDDITWESTSLPAEKEEYTDMSFPLVTFESAITSKRLNWIAPQDPAEPPARIHTDWEFRRQVAAEYQKRIQKHQTHCNPSATQVEWQHSRVSLDMMAHMQLVSVRPLQRHPDASPPPLKGAALLKLATEVLERGWVMNHDPRGSPFRWLESIFVKWHPLAVAIAELCVLTKGELVERAWPVVEMNYSKISESIADSTQGMLWRPIEKLMKKARAIRTQSWRPRNSQSPPLSGSESVSQPLDSYLSRLPASSPAGSDQLSSAVPDTAVAQAVAGPGAFGATFDGSASWSLPIEEVGSERNSSLGYSPGEAWQSWDSFVNDLQTDNTEMLDMEFAALNVPLGWDFGTGQ